MDKTPLQEELAKLHKQLLEDIRTELEQFREQLLTDLTEEFIVSRGKTEQKGQKVKPKKKENPLNDFLNKKIF